jgi:hypothetical protein
LPNYGIPKGKIADLQWPRIRKLAGSGGRISYVVDSGKRIRPRVRLRFKTLAEADIAAAIRFISHDFLPG